MALAVQASNIHVTIGGKSILRNLNLEIEQGRFYGIIGPNGAGKSTLFDTLLGFRAPTSGTVTLLGQNPVPRNTRLLSRVGVQPQQVAFFSNIRVREHLLAVAEIFKANKQRVDILLEALQLSSLSSSRVDKLSGGERQRLALATALVHQPDVVFLDEPTAALDPEARLSFVNLLSGSEELGTTVVYTTHHLDEAQRLCDTIAVLNHGQFVAQGSPVELINQANMDATILLPAVRELTPILDTLNSINGYEMTHDGLLVRTHDLSASFNELTAAGFNMTSANASNASLEDVYLHLIGGIRQQHDELQ